LTALDPRLNAFRPDLADARLEGKVAAASYVAGRLARVVAPLCDLRRSPRGDAPLDSQILCGDEVLVFEETEGWAWMQSLRDSYVGYGPSSVLGPCGDEPDHVVVAARSFVFPGPDLKLPPTACHSMGARLAVVEFVETRGTHYGILRSGEAMAAAHLVAVEGHEADFVAAAERLVGTPYLWGGTSGFGIDCSGLVQLAMRMAGKTVLRDTYMQAASIGAEIDAGDDFSRLERGDLVFWTGHVGIMLDEAAMIHANAHTMNVAVEPLAQALERIGRLYGPPTLCRRPRSR
jgi:cell wall-associated NlpC family hydrolase